MYFLFFLQLIFAINAYLMGFPNSKYNVAVMSVVI